MSYDIFCYRPKGDTPNEDEADQAIEKDNDKYSNTVDELETKLVILKALIAHDPNLNSVDYKFGSISNQPIEILKTESKRFHHIEVNSSDNDLPVRLTIYNNHVYINFPYLHSGTKARRLLEEIKKYIIIINETAGYFVFDPQLGEVYNPEVTMPHLFKTYEKSRQLVNVFAKENNFQTPLKKPWWKFW